MKQDSRTFKTSIFQLYQEERMKNKITVMGEDNLTLVHLTIQRRVRNKNKACNFQRHRKNSYLINKSS